MWGYIGKGDTFAQLSLDLFCDADFAGERPTFRSTSGNYLTLLGASSDFPIAAKSKTEKTISHSSAESETMSMSRGLRAMALPGLDLMEAINTKDITELICHEDNEATIAIIKSGKNPNNETYESNTRCASAIVV